MRWKSHVRFGGRAGETHPPKAGRALRSDPYTKLLGPAKWTYFYLYVILDVYSRYVVGWMVAHREHAELAERLIAETIAKQGIPAGQLTLHADRGMLDDLQAGRVPARRPRRHQDPLPTARLQRQPLLRGQFKTLKYRPGFPDRFASIEEARAFCQDFFRWYNAEHRHSGIGLLPPEVVHYGQAAGRHDARAQVLATAYAAHPERFVRRPPAPRPTSHRGLDQSTRVDTGGDSVNNPAWCLRIVDRFRPVGRVVLTGLGGVGKTSVAVEYVYRRQADYEVVWCVNGEQPASLLADLAALAGKLGLATDAPQEAQVAALRGWLERHRRWLLVLDNVVDPQAVVELLPRSATGQVVITSRTGVGWERLASVLPVEVLAPADASGLLLARTEETGPAAESGRNHLGDDPRWAAAGVGAGRRLRGRDGHGHPGRAMRSCLPPGRQSCSTESSRWLPAHRGHHLVGGPATLAGD